MGFKIVQENLKIPPFLMTRGFDPCTPRFEVWCSTNCATWACELVMSLSSYSALISTDSYRILHTVIQQFPTQFPTVPKGSQQFPTVPNSSQQLEHHGREGTLHLASNGLCVIDGSSSHSRYWKILSRPHRDHCLYLSARCYEVRLTRNLPQVKRKLKIC